VGDRLLFREARAGDVRPTRETPFSQGMPYRPWGAAPCRLPGGFRDVEEDAEAAR
jgi:hypothetical protein